MNDDLNVWISMIQSNIYARQIYLKTPFNILAKRAGISYNGWHGIKFIKGVTNNIELRTLDTIAMMLLANPVDLLKPDYSPNHDPYLIGKEDIGRSDDNVKKNLDIYDRKLRYKLTSGKQQGIRLHTLFYLAREELTTPSAAISSIS